MNKFCSLWNHNCSKLNSFLLFYFNVRNRFQHLANGSVKIHTCKTTSKARQICEDLLISSHRNFHVMWHINEKQNIIARLSNSESRVQDVGGGDLSSLLILLTYLPSFTVHSHLFLLWHNIWARANELKVRLQYFS